MKFNLMNDKLYYLSLGDSITESLNVDYNYGIAGYFDKKNNKIHGISYPAYLSTMYQKLGINIENFENFALSGSKTTDWLYFLGDKNYSYKNSREYIENYTMKINSTKEGMHNRIKKNFKDFGKENESDFDFLKKEITKANLITMTIGANDIIKNLKTIGLIDIFLGKNKTEINIEIMNKIILETKSNIKKIIQKIKLINKNNVEIYLLGYLKPFNRINKVISKIPNAKIFNDLCKNLNKIIEQAAKEEKINYINFFNNEEWLKNAKYFTKYCFDIHPSIIGYKKIAQQLFIKTTMNNLFFLEAKDNQEIIKYFSDINQEYFLSDHKKFESYFNFGSDEKQIQKIINIAEGTNKSFLFEKDKNQQEYITFFKPKPNIFSYLSTTITLLGQTSVEPSIKIMYESLKIWIKKDIHIIEKFFKNKSNLKTLHEIILSADYINYFFGELQRKIEENDDCVNNIKIFNSTLTALLSDDKLLFLFFKNILTTLENNKKRIDFFEFKTTFSLIFKKIISSDEKINEFIKIANFKTKEFSTYNNASFPERINEIIIKNLFSPKLIDKTSESMFDSFISLIKEAKNINDFESFFKNFLNKLFFDFRKNSYVFEIIKINKKEISTLLSDYLISLFYLKNLNKDEFLNIELFTEMILDKFIKTRDFDLIVINILTFFKFKKLYDCNLADFFFLLSSNDLNKIFLSLFSLKLNKNEEKIICIFLNTLFARSHKEKGLLYVSLRNLNPPNAFIKVKDKTVSLLNISKTMISKFNSLTGLIKFIFNIVYSQYMSTKENNDKDKVLFESLLYRIVASITLTSFLVFQKNNKINIFWFGNETKINVFPSIISVIYSTLTDGITSPLKIETINNIFYDPIKKIKGKILNENNYKPENFLYIISSSQRYPNYKFKENKTKIEVIIDSIIEGKPINRV